MYDASEIKEIKKFVNAEVFITDYDENSFDQQQQQVLFSLLKQSITVLQKLLEFNY